MLMSIFVMGTRSFSEGFASIWSALMLLILSIGGTMIMRKFHNSMAVGFFMGGVVAMSQMFFLLFLIYIGYGRDQIYNKESAKGEGVMSLLCLVQCLLLGSFAAILGAHRSEILDKPFAGMPEMEGEMTNNQSNQYIRNTGQGESVYDPPTRASTDSGHS